MAILDTRLLSVEEFESVEGDFELDEGRLVPMSPAGGWHGWLCIRFGSIMGEYVEASGFGLAFGNDTGFVLQVSPGTVRGPDVAVVRRDRVPVDWKTRGWIRIPPDVAVEVKSPSNTAGQLQKKVAQYLEAGVKLVWVVYPDPTRVLAYWADGRVDVYNEHDELDGGEALPGFRCPVTRLLPPD